MIYLDNAATTFPKPSSVVRAAANACLAYGANPGRGGHKLSAKAGEEVYLCREKLALMFSGEVERTVFTLNCTHSLNIAIKGVLKKGDHVITSSLEHNSVLRPLEFLRQNSVISYDVAKVEPQNEEITIRNFEKLITPRTKLIVCSYASNVFGTVLPVRELAKLCKKRGLLFAVDCAQSAGLFKIDMERDGIDIICAPGHKGLFGPMGTGVLMFSKNTEIKPLFQGGTGSLSLRKSQPELYPDALESGTLNLPGIAGLSAGLDFIRSVGGEEAIHQKEQHLVKRLKEELYSVKNITVFDDMHGKVFAPTLSLSVDGMHSEQVAQMLDGKSIAVRSGYHCSYLAHTSRKTTETGTVRVSPGFFNSERDIEFFIFCLNKIAIGGKI